MIYEPDSDPFNEDNTAVFRGFYHGATGRRLVVRPGLGTDDVVTIDPNLNVRFVSDEDEDGAREVGIAASGVADVLVMALDGDDRVVVNAAINTVINGGSDGDE